MNTVSPLTTGTSGAYHWLTTDKFDFDSLIEVCPSVVLRKYLAVTAFDSGPLALVDVPDPGVWKSRGSIAYSSQIESIENLPLRVGFDEWYVFDQPTDLGQVRKGNVFDAQLLPGQLYVFVNFAGFSFQRPGVKSLTDLYWRQLEWISPVSYIADGTSLSFVTRDNNAFEEVCRALEKSSS